MAAINDDGALQEFQFLTKNLSYEGGYHRRVYYPKLVVDRVHQRTSFQQPNGSAGSLWCTRNSSSSLPDLPEALLQAAEDDVSASELTGLLRRQLSESNENLQCLERGRESRRIPFSVGGTHDDGLSSSGQASDPEIESTASLDSATTQSTSSLVRC